MTLASSRTQRYSWWSGKSGCSKKALFIPANELTYTAVSAGHGYHHSHLAHLPKNPVEPVPKLHILPVQWKVAGREGTTPVAICHAARPLIDHAHD